MTGTNDQAPELNRLQQWMQEVITHPGGVAAGVRSEAAQQRVAVDFELLEQVVTPSEALTGAQRLAIYWRSYHARLLQCFQSMFPGLLHALGNDLFNHFALDYLGRHPPHSYTLDRLADNFPQHLAETRPDAGAPPHARERWPDFIIELASLELAFVQVYDSAGLEGQPEIAMQEIYGLAHAQLLQCRPVPAPCLRLFHFCYPVHTYQRAVQRGERPALPDPAESYLALTRQNFQIALHPLTAPQYAFLQALDGHHTIGQAGERAAPLCGFDQLPAPTMLGWLGNWTAKGFFERIDRCGAL